MDTPKRKRTKTPKSTRARTPPGGMRRGERRRGRGKRRQPRGRFRARKNDAAQSADFAAQKAAATDWRPPLGAPLRKRLRGAGAAAPPSRTRRPLRARGGPSASPSSVLPGGTVVRAPPSPMRRPSVSRRPGCDSRHVRPDGTRTGRRRRKSASRHSAARERTRGRTAWRRALKRLS